MNRRYHFDHLYVDEGFGTSQIQFIKQYSLDQFGSLPPDHPDLKLAQIVGINFSSKLDTRDVITGAEEKKDMKTYMVENAVRYLERQMFVFDEMYDKELMDQMGNYIIKSRSPTGRPTYAAEDAKIGDHDLDAFMLAMLGFSMEYSQFLNSQVSDTIVKLVSRKYMESGDEIVTPDMLEYNPETLIAETGTRKRASDLFNKRISGYNRSTFEMSTTLSDIRKGMPKIGSDGYYKIEIGNNERSSRPKGRASFK